MDLRLQLLGIGGTLLIVGALGALVMGLVAAATGGAATLVIALAVAVALAIGAAVLFTLADLSEPPEVRYERLERALSAARPAPNATSHARPITRSNATPHATPHPTSQRSDPATI